jgi:putative flippase GtrA
VSEPRSGNGALGRSLRLLLSRQFGLFILAGGAAAAIHWGSRIWLNHYVDFRIALVLAYGIGIATAYALNKRFVFTQSGRSVKGEVRWFVFFNLAAFPLVWGASVFLAEQALPGLGLLWHPREIAHAIAIALPLVLNFYLHKLVTFREAPGESSCHKTST